MHNVLAFVLDMPRVSKVRDAAEVPGYFKLNTLSRLEVNTSCPKTNLNFDNLARWNPLISVVRVERPVWVHRLVVVNCALRGS
jgi:hypothetical protein